MEAEKIFGDINNFGIRFIPSPNTNHKGSDFALLHLVLDGQIIGNPEEECLVGTWISGLERLLDIIDSKFEVLSQAEFMNKSDNEIFELIYKSNQLEQEYDEKYKYLKVLDNEVWQYCNLTLDETIDAYLITITGFNENVKIIWKGLSEPCPLNKIGLIQAVLVEKEKMKKVLSDCIFEVKNYYNY